MIRHVHVAGAVVQVDDGCFIDRSLHNRASSFHHYSFSRPLLKSEKEDWQRAADRRARFRAVTNPAA